MIGFIVLDLTALYSIQKGAPNFCSSLPFFSFQRPKLEKSCSMKTWTLIISPTSALQLGRKAAETAAAVSDVQLIVEKIYRSATGRKSEKRKLFFLF